MNQTKKIDDYKKRYIDYLMSLKNLYNTEKVILGCSDLSFNYYSLQGVYLILRYFKDELETYKDKRGIGGERRPSSIEFKLKRKYIKRYNLIAYFLIEVKLTRKQIKTLLYHFNKKELEYLENSIWERL